MSRLPDHSIVETLAAVQAEVAVASERIESSDKNQERTARILDGVERRMSAAETRIAVLESHAKRDARDARENAQRVRFLETRTGKWAGGLALVTFLISNFAVIVAVVRFLAGGGAP